MAGLHIPRAALLAFCCALILVAGCKKKTTIPVDSTITFEIRHEVHGVPLLTDTLIYQNAAGNAYSATRLEYYLSDFNFLGDGQTQTVEMVHYVNPLKTSSLQITADLKTGTYKALQFFIGLPPEENVSYHLPSTPENINMAWPDMMGGGYHFLKFEGHYLDQAQDEKGFAMHLGMNKWLVTVMLSKPLLIDKEAHTLRLTMDLNQWFTNPHTYNFDVQGNYTMGVDSLMQKLSENGSSVFNLTQEP